MMQVVTMLVTIWVFILQQERDGRLTDAWLGCIGFYVNLTTQLKMHCIRRVDGGMDKKDEGTD